MEKELFVQACRDRGQAMERAMRLMYRDYEPALRYEASKAFADAPTVHDAVQECLFKAWHSCATFRGESELFPWLKAILRRVILDKVRQRREESPLFTEDGEVQPEVEARLREFLGAAHDPTGDAVQRRQETELFVRAYARFAAKYPLCAKILLWVAEDGLKPGQIASLLAKSDAAMRQQLSDCRERLRSFLPDRPRRRAPKAGGAPDED
jgi:RNA polymerase sigma factor (sigma-70 family)